MYFELKFPLNWGPWTLEVSLQALSLVLQEYEDDSPPTPENSEAPPAGSPETAEEEEHIYDEIGELEWTEEYITIFQYPQNQNLYI